MKDTNFRFERGVGVYSSGVGKTVAAPQTSSDKSANLFLGRVGLLKMLNARKLTFAAKPPPLPQNSIVVPERRLVGDSIMMAAIVFRVIFGKTIVSESVRVSQMDGKFGRQLWFTRLNALVCRNQMESLNGRAIWLKLKQVKTCLENFTRKFGFAHTLPITYI